MLRLYSLAQLWRPLTAALQSILAQQVTTTFHAPDTYCVTACSCGTTRRSSNWLTVNGRRCLDHAVKQWAAWCLPCQSAGLVGAVLSTSAAVGCQKCVRCRVWHTLRVHAMMALTGRECGSNRAGGQYCTPTACPVMQPQHWSALSLPAHPHPFPCSS